MKTWCCLFALASCCAANAAEVKMSVIGPNGINGSATVDNRVLEDGSKYVRLSMELRTGNGPAVNVLQESTYDAKGFPVRKLQVTSTKGTKLKQSLAAVFTAEGAEVTVDSGDKHNTSEEPYPPGASVRAGNEFWFVRDKVKPGGVLTYKRFDLMLCKWVETKVTYLGRRTISVAGQARQAHLVTVGTVKTWVDEVGDPLRMEMGQTVLERI